MTGLVARWIFLVVTSAALTAAINLAGLPASFLIGPMFAAIALATTLGPTKLPPIGSRLAQAVVGCLIAASIESSLFAEVLADWPVLIGATLATLVASGALGALIARLGILPGTTAIWGSAPGAASAMVLMADAFGADVRLVAFMQYVRVIIVSVTAAVVARLFLDGGASGGPPVDWFPPIEAGAFATTILVAGGGSLAGMATRLPAGVFLGPMLAGLAVHAGFGLPLQLPPWLLAASYVLVGWTIGLRFDREVLSTAARSLPQVAVAVFALLAFCGFVAWLLVRLLGIDPLTAYLATSPGGMDTIAIISAASGSVDIAFVMAMQMSRFLIVLLAGPPVARWIANRTRDR